MAGSRRPLAWDRLPSWAPLLALAGLALAAAATGLGNGFAYDDVHLVARNPAVHQISDLPARFIETYWPEVALGQAGRLYRPLTIAGFSIQWAIGGGSPLVFHLTNTILYILVSLLVYAVARRLMASGPATLAAAFFAVHPVHTEAVGNVVGQGELLAAALLLAGTVVYLDSRIDRLTRGRILGISACYVLACLAKEHAVMWPLLLVPLGWAVPQRKSAKESREETMRLFLILAAELIVYLAVRQSVVGGFTGDLQHPLWRGTTFATRAITMLAAVPVWSRLLLWPAHLQADYAPQEMTLAHSLGPDQWQGLFLLAVLAVLFAASWRWMPVAAAGLGWTMLAVAPVANLVTPTGIVLAERTLFLASVGLALFIGALAAALEQWLPHEPRLVRRIATAVVLLLCCAGIARSARRLPVWRDNTTLFGTTIVDAPRSYWAWRNWAGDLVLTGHPAEARAAYERSLGLYDRDPTVYDDLASFERRGGRCDLAIPHFRASLAIDSTRYMTTSRLIGCLTAVGDFDAARVLARSAMAAGRKEFGALLQLVDSAAAVRPR
jgi:hypothetical protein